LQKLLSATGFATAVVGLALNEIGSITGLSHIVAVYDQVMHRMLQRCSSAREPGGAARDIGGVTTLRGALRDRSPMGRRRLQDAWRRANAARAVSDRGCLRASGDDDAPKFVAGRGERAQITGAEATEQKRSDGSPPQSKARAQMSHYISGRCMHKFYALTKAVIARVMAAAAAKIDRIAGSAFITVSFLFVRRRYGPSQAKVRASQWIPQLEKILRCNQATMLSLSCLWFV
jgi:hypothetical protein